MKRLVLIIVVLAAMAPARGQERAVSANFADAAQLGTLNLTASYGFAKHWSLDAVCRYNPFTWNFSQAAGGAAFNKMRSAGVGLRFWPWHIYSGWWISGRAQWQEYRTSGWKEETSSEGDRYGGVLMAGYSFMVSKHFNVDVGFGAWGGYGSTTQYACPTCGRVLSAGYDYFLLPSEAVLSLSYVF